MRGFGWNAALWSSLHQSDVWGVSDGASPPFVCGLLDANFGFPESRSGYSTNGGVIACPIRPLGETFTKVAPWGFRITEGFLDRSRLIHWPFGRMVVGEALARPAPGNLTTVFHPTYLYCNLWGKVSNAWFPIVCNISVRFTFLKFPLISWFLLKRIPPSFHELQ